VLNNVRTKRKKNPPKIFTKKSTSDAVGKIIKIISCFLGSEHFIFKAGLKLKEPLAHVHFCTESTDTILEAFKKKIFIS
jgi:hypothetical protein